MCLVYIELLERDILETQIVEKQARLRRPQLTGSEGKVYLLNQALEKQDNLTLWDIYNAFTNYSEHNKRSISVGKRNKPKEIPKEYEIRQSNMDKIKSNETRSADRLPNTTSR